MIKIEPNFKKRCKETGNLKNTYIMIIEVILMKIMFLRSYIQLMRLSSGSLDSSDGLLKIGKKGKRAK